MSNKESNPYQPFNTFIFRSPFFPLSLLVDWLAELDRSPGYLKEILGRSDIHEAIFFSISRSLQ
ncbi:MAG: hypothetical protein PHS38_08990 [Bacteroidales bacterium]|nr:hypothetical protein [Bacteroidales bacterium]MDD4500520.1 hypothetical protein [Bacteroidales bacterium]